MASSRDEAFWAPIGSIFDLTLKFEQIVFSLSFSSLAVLLSIFLFRHYYQKPVYARNGMLLGAKLATTGVIFASQIASLVLWAVATGRRTNTAIPATAIELLAAACLAAIIYIEHRHSIRSSASTSIYLILSLAFEVCRSRSFFLRPGFTALGSMAAVAAGMRLMLLALQEISKRSLLLDDALRQNCGFETTSGFIGRVLFLFLKPVFATGFRAELLLRHLDQLDPELSAEVLYQKLEPHWQPRRLNPSSNELVKACFKAWKDCVGGLVFSRLIVTAFNFSQPFVLRRVINLVDKPHQDNIKERGGVQAAATFMFIGIALSRTTHLHLMNRFVTRMRGGLVTLIIHKAHSITEEEAKRSAAVTLMTTDIDGITTGIPQCLQIPIGILEIVLGMYVLSRFIGISAFSVFGPLVASTIVAYFVARSMATRFSSWNKDIELRVAKTAKILPQITAIKMLGLGPTVATFLQYLRDQEIECSKSYRRLQALGMGPVLIGDLMTPVVVIAAALFGPAFQGQMSAAEVFPVLTVVSIIQIPLLAVLETFSRWGNMLACFSRIQKFLCLAEKRDPRSITVTSLASSNESVDVSHASSLVRFRQTDIAPLGMKEPLLRKVNFSLTPGSTTGLVGLTGGGKSTIVQGILGQSEILGGSVSVNTDEIGYCGENVWLRDITIRENIIGDLEFNQARFTSVIRACFLEEDLQWLPGGADYIVGTNGSNLSGGQRQRVGLARTAYAEHRVTILDDAFSSLDHETAVCILHQLIGRKGIFPRAGYSVFVVTHLPACLDLVDQLLVLEGSRCNVLKERRHIDEYRGKLDVALTTLNHNVAVEKEQREQRALRTSLEGRAASVAFNNAALRQRGDVRLYGLFIRPIGWVKMGLHTALTSLYATGEVVPEIYLRIWIETNPDKSAFFIGYAGVVVATCFLGCLVYWLLYAKLSPRSSSQLHQKLVDSTMGSTLRFLSTTKTGTLLNRYSQDMTLLSRNLPAALLRTIHCGTNAMIQIGIVLAGATHLAVSLPIILIILFFIQRYYLRTSRQVRHLDLETKAPLHTFFEETATGLTHIQAFRWQVQNIHRGIILLEDSQKPFYVFLAIQQWLGMVLGLLAAGLGTSLVALALFMEQSSSSSSVGLSFMGLIYLNLALQNTLVAWTALETSSGALARLSLFEKETPQEPRRTSEKLPKDWPTKGQVEMRNVFANYTPEDDESSCALRDVSVSIPAGQRIGIMGRSGSGKSSLFLTMLGFISYEGVIEIDGVDIASISLDDLRCRIITITQDQVQFDATIRTNLLPFTMNDGPCNLDEKAMKRDMDLEQLLKSLHIWIPLAKKGGLDANLYDVGYSKGQMQLLCIARAIMRQRETGSRLVLIDEGTSSIDERTEKIVNRIMKENFAGCTVLTIAHRSSAVANYDGLLRLDRGATVDPARESDSESAEEAN
ncbi:Canalicular multispecific organic anion transporter 2 [Beauveria bassiana D1-5]|uniref:Canalicular multispecific organic anion transporter 2 n=1 Tax=Beauveria bassiana D1-5 TaxID=1245745 RepID=A0A0A2VRM3_BEABA|nr:Canalicular multispecific organic anion transporter 2 [Beauveria bassiana D1-5]